MNKFKKTLILLLCLIISISLIGCGADKKADSKGATAPVDKTKPLKMGFVPQVDSDKLIDSLKPLENLLSKSMDRKVEAFTATNYVGVVEALGSSEVDFAIISPFAYALAHKEYGAKVIFKALNKSGKSSYNAEFIVKKDSGIKSLEEIKGKRVAFVDPSSTSGYIFPAAKLVQMGIDLDKDIKTINSGGHDKSLQLLLNGDVDVVCVFNGAREKFAKEFTDIMEKTEIIDKTDDIPYICVVVRGNMDPETEKSIKTAIQTNLNSGEGLETIKKLFNLYGFEEATNADYEVIVNTAKVMKIDLKKE